MRLWRITYILLFAGALLAIDKNASISQHLEKSEINIADRVHYSVVVQYPESAKVAMSPVGANLGMFEIKDFSSTDPTPVKDKRGTLERDFDFTISSFEVGELTIPPIGMLVMYPDGDVDTLITQPMKITVKSLLEGKDPSQLDIRDVKPPVPYPTRFPWVWVASAAALLLVAALIIWYIRRKRVGKGLLWLGSPPKPAYEIALSHLDELKNPPLATPEQVKAYYIELSDLFRTYIENGLGCLAMEMTTAETIYGLQTANTENSLIEMVSYVLGLSDMVKFAKVIPEKDEAQTCWEKVNTFVLATMPAKDGLSENENDELLIQDDKDEFQGKEEAAL